MPVNGPEYLPLTDWAALYMIVVARLSAVIFLMPGIGEQVMPVRIRLALLLGASLALASSGLVSVPNIAPISGYLTLLVSELTIGLVLGVGMRGLLWILSIVGAIVAQSIGLAQFLGVALQTEAQTIVANLLSITGAAALLTMNFHVLAFVTIADLYRETPVGVLIGFDPGLTTDALFASFGFAVMLSWPFILANLIYNICLGFINKAMPQLMVAFVGAPFMVGAGLFLLMVSVISLFFVWQDRAPALFGWA